LLAVIEEPGPSAHLKLFVFTSNDPTSPPAVDPSAADPFEDPSWRPHLEAPNQYADIVDLFIGGSPARYLWVGALLWSDGRSTPVISQMRVEFDHQTYLEHLPAIYDTESTCGDFLLRLVSLLEGMFGSVEGEIADLSRLFDVDAVPREFLGWLAGWLALDLNEDWDDSKKRDLIRRAFSLYSRRGTVEGLRESLRLFAGVEVIIEEPIINAAWWALPAREDACECGAPGGGCSCESATGSTRRSGCECGCKSSSRNTPGGCADSAGEGSWTATECSILGVTTMLAAAQPQGAVMGTTAILNRSDLIDGDEFGSPLFTDVAYQFTVQVYRGQLRCADSLTRVRTVLQREKPAHAVYHLCVIEPLLRAGYQARVGIDAVVAGPQQPFGFGEGLLGEDTTLAGQPPARLGEDSRLGITTRVG
jgi:phage tail-like protein